MKQVSAKGTVETAYGQNLKEIKKEDGTFHEPFDFTFSYEAYENMNEVRAANDLLNDKEYVNVKNNSIKAAARSKAIQEELDKRGIKKPTLEGNQDLQLKTLIQVLVAAGRSEQEAEQVARVTLGLPPSA